MGVCTIWKRVKIKLQTAESFQIDRIEQDSPVQTETKPNALKC